MAEYEVGGVTVEAWQRSIGRDPNGATMARWIKMGLITPVNVLGKHFITKEEDERFWARAKSGEFAQECTGVIEMQKRKEGKQ